MASVNEVRLMGNLGRDPELRYTANGTAVATLSLATSRRWTNKETGEQVEDTQWHRVVVWGKQAELVGEHKKSGDQLYIAGRLEHRSWEKEDGTKGYVTEVIASQVLFTGRAPKGGVPHPADGAPPKWQAGAKAKSTEGDPSGYIPTEPNDDDIPF